MLGVGSESSRTQADLLRRLILARALQSPNLMHLTHRAVPLAWLAAATASASLGQLASPGPNVLQKTPGEPMWRSELLSDAMRRTLAEDKPPFEISGQIQFRFIAGHEDEPRDDGKDIQSGFVMRRLKVGIDGELMEGRVEYSITGAFSRDGGTMSLDDATVTYKLRDDLRFRYGKFRPPFLREESLSSKRQLMVERSLIESGFGQNRLQGIALQYEKDQLRVVGGIMDGGIEFGENQIWSFSARAEWLLEGKFKEFKDFTSFPEDDDATMIGLGVLYLDRELDAASDEDSQSYRATLDYSKEWEGENLFVVGVFERLTEDGQGPADRFGFLVQGGVFVTDKLELIGRYEWAKTDDGRPDLSVISAGFNYYFMEHSLKLTGDIGYGLNEVSGFFDSTGTGWRRDRTGDDGQVVARLQMQLLY